MIGLLRLRTYDNLLRLAKWLGMDVAPDTPHAQHWKVVSRE